MPQTLAPSFSRHRKQESQTTTSRSRMMTKHKNAPLSMRSRSCIGVGSRANQERPQKPAQCTVKRSNNGDWSISSTETQRQKQKSEMRARYREYGTRALWAADREGQSATLSITTKPVTNREHANIRAKPRTSTPTYSQKRNQKWKTKKQAIRLFAGECRPHKRPP